jgi:hypothetical protein
MEELLERAARDLVNSRYEIVLTGAWISGYLLQGKPAKFCLGSLRLRR